MASLTYTGLSAYASWASVHQKAVAEDRVKASLTNLLAKRGTWEFWSSNWRALGASLMTELRDLDRQWAGELERLQGFLDEYTIRIHLYYERLYVLTRYMGPTMAAVYINRFGMLRTSHSLIRLVFAQTM
jgi:hypothetical protein